MQLTTHFSLEELTHSDTAVANGIENTPLQMHFEALKVLAASLEKIRALFGVPMTINSGYRNPQVNAMVGGVSDSDHALGYAADFHVQGLTDLAAAIRIRDSGIRFDQLIYEHGRCVHFSVHPRMRQQVLSQPGGPGSRCYEGLV